MVKIKQNILGVKSVLIVLIITISASKVASQQVNRDYFNTDLPISQRVEILLSQMTLNEKVGQLRQCNLSSEIENGQFKEGAMKRIFDDKGAGTLESPFFYTADIARIYNQAQKYLVEETRLGIPGLLIAECLHGHLAVGSTIFPQSIGLGCTWNPDLINQMAQAIAREASSVGVKLALAPVLDLSKDQRFGRVEECYGEDPFLVSQMGIAYIKGMQEGNEDENKRVMCMAKHFAAYSVPNGGINLGPALIGERELRTYHLPPFEAAVKQANVRSIMPAYNELDGIPAHKNSFLLNDILRDEWEFNGFVFSDYEGIDMMKYFQKVVSTRKEAAFESIKAGVDLEAPNDICYRNLEELVKEGSLKEEILNQSVRRILQAKFEAGLFENPFIDESKVSFVINNEEHIQLALKIAEESVVLLKNEDILPFNSSKSLKYAVCGPNADRVQFGDYSYSKRKEDGITVLEGLQKFIGSENILYTEGCDITALDTTGFEEAVKNAEESDIAIVVVGGTSAILSGIGWGGGTSDINTCGEGFDRATLEIPGVQLDLIKAIKRTGRPVVVVMLNGRAYSIPWLKENVEGIVEAWYPGEMGGRAIANILFGEVNPSGKLSVSFPQSGGHCPSNYNRKPSGHGFYHKPGTIEKPGRDYVFSTPKPLYPFGFGLSYSEFSFENIKINQTEYNKSDTLKIGVDVKNTGLVDGTEVIQVYVNDLVSSVTTPVKELKGFKKVNLGKGEKTRINFSIPIQSLWLIDSKMQKTVESGEFEILIGNSSENLPLRKIINVK